MLIARSCQSQHLTGKYRANGSKHGADIFSKKPDQETTQTYTWILSHLEEDQNVSLPKQEVYDEYRAYCQANRFEPLCVADFGKAMKHALPCIKPRRLGQRGNSRYCYSGLRKKYRIEPPSLPDMIELSNVCNPLTPCAYQNGAGELDGPKGHHQRLASCSNYEHRSLATVVAMPSSALSTSSTSSSSSSCSSSYSSSSSSSSSSSAGTRNQANQTMQNVKQNVMNLKQEPCGGAGPLESCPAAGAPANTTNGPQNHQTDPTCCRQDAMAPTAEMSSGPASSTSMASSVLTGAGPVYGSANQQTGHLHRRVLRPASVAPSELAHHQYHHQNQHHHQHHHATRHHNHSQPSHHHPNHHHHQQVPLIPRYDHSQQSSSYQDYQPRSGTPDDDDYRHNYHDLNRPMVGPAIIPFSQSFPAQLAQQPASHESFLTYNTISYPPLAPVVDNAYQQQQQQQQPIVQVRHSPKVVAPLGDGETHQSRHQPAAPMPDCCSNGTVNKQGKSPGTLTQAGEPFEQLGSNDNSNVGQESSTEVDQRQVDARQQFEQSSSASKYPTLAHLNLNFNESVASAEIDFASPFQSPASTPYPMINGASYLASESQDYCSGECNIQYTADQ